MSGCRPTAISCGICQVFAIDRNPDTIIKDVQLNGGMASAMIIFSNNTHNQAYTNALLKKIKEHSLGHVEESDEVTNPNTNNKIILYTWYVNRTNLQQYPKIITKTPMW